MIEPNLTVEVDQRNGASTMVRAAGEIDLHGAPRLEQALTSACEEAEPRGRVHADLRQVEFIDTPGLSVLVRAHQLAQRRYLHLEVQVAHNTRVLRVLQMAGLHQILRINTTTPD